MASNEDSRCEATADLSLSAASRLRRRPTRRPSYGRIGKRASASSIVQQKLQAALQSAERNADSSHIHTHQTSFRANGVAGAAAAEKAEADRSISRYRNDAAVVSFTESPSTSSSSASNSFCYSNNFMPGVHFYTFLASEDSIDGKKTPADYAVPDSPSRPQSHPTKLQGSIHARKSTALKMWIPDTIVYGETGRAVWLHSDENGFVQRSTEVSDKLVMDRLVNSFRVMDLDPIVVCKEPTTASAVKQPTSEKSGLAYQGNLLRLLSPSELKTVLSNVSSARSSKSFALQKFVKCKGSRAFIVRAVHEAGKPSYAWMINNTTPMVAASPTVSQVLLSLGQDSNGQTASPQPRSGSVTVLAPTMPQYSLPTNEASAEGGRADSSAPTIATIPVVNRVCTSVPIDKSCTFIKLSERGYTTVSELNQRLVKYIEHRLHVQLEILVSDFIKDADGRWWLLQVKHFRVKHKRKTTNRYYSLPRRLRMLYLGYRDSSVVEETTDSDEEHDRERLVAKLAAQFTQRHVRKLTQCKCCLAAYPKEELSFKMTLKMINEMLVRIRSRLSTEKSYTFLATALARESPDPSLAYESWSVCSYCYAIYERDQQLQKVESRFGEILGTPDRGLVPLGLGKLDDRATMIDPSASSTVFPSQLTLCRLMLVVNGIYDIPPELYDAEKDGSRLRPTDCASASSRLYLRISALGYTECIPVDPSSIEVSYERAPRGTRRRRSSTVSEAENSDSDTDVNEDHPQRPMPRQTSGRNYWLPLNLIRTIHFFAPRTPLHAKLKETSGLTPFLNEDNSISIQFFRATEPPLHDPTPTTTPLAERGRIRRTALQPQPNGLKLDIPVTAYTPPGANHCVLLGATKIRMAQFRSAYVTKLDFYACMALTGEMFNIKGNIGLERVRYVDTKIVTSRYRLRMYNGVYIPDESYVPSDPLTSEWMDCLRAAITPATPNLANRILSDRKLTKGSGLLKGIDMSRSWSGGKTVGSLASVASMSSGNEDMDEELEKMIDDASAAGQAKSAKLDEGRMSSTSRPPTAHPQEGITRVVNRTAVRQQPLPTSEKLDSLVRGTTVSATEIDSNMPMQMAESGVLPKKNDSRTAAESPDELDLAFGSRSQSMWCFVVQLNHVHNLQSRERPYCRWECYYDLFGQRRSAVERSPSTGPQTSTAQQPDEPSIPTDSGPVLRKVEVTFNCTHKFYLSASAPMLGQYMRSKPNVTLHLRNDVYSSTRSQVFGEFFCSLDISPLAITNGPIDATIDVQPAPSAPELTPREAALVSRSPPYLTASVQLTQLTLRPQDAVSSGDFVVVGNTSEGITVLKKVA